MKKKQSKKKTAQGTYGKTSEPPILKLPNSRIGPYNYNPERKDFMDFRKLIWLSEEDELFSEPGL